MFKLGPPWGNWVYSAERKIGDVKPTTTNNKNMGE